MMILMRIGAVDFVEDCTGVVDLMWLEVCDIVLDGFWHGEEGKLGESFWDERLAVDC